MPLVLIPPIRNGAGAPVDALVTIALVDAKGRRQLGWNVPDGGQVAEFLEYPLGSTELSIPLLAQSDIAVSPAVSTWYVVTIAAGAYAETKTYRVQVPSSAFPVALKDLVGAAAIPPGDILAGRLLPGGGEPGQTISKAPDGAVAWVDPASVGNIDGGTFN